MKFCVSSCKNCCIVRHPEGQLHAHLRLVFPSSRSKKNVSVKAREELCG
jgi:hypothetical protein